MIVSLFNHGRGKAEGATDYLLGNDANGNPRNPAPVILKGNRLVTELMINSNHRALKYTSGVIAFRDDEKPSNDQIMKIINFFEKSFAPGLEYDRFPFLWVLHQEKGNTELHFLTPTQDALTRKQFTLIPPGAGFRKMIQNFQCVINHLMKYEQVIQKDVFKPFKPRFEGFKGANDIRSYVEYIVKYHTSNNSIKNRNDLLKILEENNFIITRTGNDYISIKHKDEKKAVRLKGLAYSVDVDYQLLINNNSSRQLEELEYDKSINELKESTEIRKLSIEKSLARVSLDSSPTIPATSKIKI